MPDFAFVGAFEENYADWGFSRPQVVNVVNSQSFDFFGKLVPRRALRFVLEVARHTISECLADD
jgi:hypothetical protein